MRCVSVIRNVLPSIFFLSFPLYSINALFSSLPLSMDVCFCFVSFSFFFLLSLSLLDLSLLFALPLFCCSSKKKPSTFKD
ncbi:hypothetical protein STCU_10450 [Strigomonas culicis]|uniref:Uncharacterized protein n=1 Tax=Strigomonas culicis TaxID=28005 RepID=S9UT54_9TRYP|nr:hypothetical protein STCU_10450 [Strigomonas culicis]|eukprot:EPY17731.1 hypothetical protein STCU_10450 [Strigomonas culicis]